MHSSRIEQAGACERVPGNGAKELVDRLLCLPDGFKVNDTLSAIGEGLGRRAVLEPEVLIRPHRVELLALHADARTATDLFPLAFAPNPETIKNFISGTEKMTKLLGGVSWGRRDAEALLANGNGGIVDALHIDAVVGEERVGCRLCECGVADENRYDV